MAASSSEMKCKKGQIIFREGEYGSTMYDIRWGSVGVYSAYGTSEERLLTTLGPEDCFGELGLIDTMPRSATVVVLENDTLLHEIDIKSFSNYVNNQPSKILKIMEHMSLRMRRMTNDYIDACKTISEYLETENTAAPLSTGLLEKMKRFAGIYRQKAGK